MTKEPIPFAGWVDIGFNLAQVPAFSGLSKKDIDVADALTDRHWEDKLENNHDDL